jgi:hypothetical protein
MLDIRAIPALKLKRASTSSTPAMGSVHNIKAGISAATTREVFFLFEQSR